MKILVSATSILALCSAFGPVGCSDDGADPIDPEAALSPLAERVMVSSRNADPTRGGRLYDRFYRENPNTGFSPDSADTTGVADGTGGPSQNGTLLDGTGVVVTNDLDHGFRLKNFYGWDMRGTAGVYGPEYQNKAYVLPYNLVDDPMTRQTVTQLLVDGAPGVPAFGGAIPETDLADLVDFVMAVRDHRLPQPGDIWDLNANSPKGYVLRPSGNVAAGQQAIEGSCANSNCHGSDGTSLLFDDGEFSLGSLSRASAYEVWLKIVAGNPGTAMGSQVQLNRPWQEQSQMVLDVLTALCDTTTYPAGAATEPDVLPGDVRCGDYLQ